MRQLLLFISVYCFIASSVWAQQFPGGFPGGGGGFPGGSGGFPGTGGSFPGGGAGRPGGQGPSVGIDDSTKVIYGPKTTKFFLENDVFNNRRTLYLTDTALVGAHQFEFTKRNRNLLTDLGNLGTPLRPVFYNTPTQIGAQTGFYVFSPFGFQTDQVRYYDTKSPFTDMYLVLGGSNQNILTFGFTQNITPRTNIGFNVQRFTSEQQFGAAGLTQNQRLLAQNWSVLLHGNYRSEDNKYILLAHLNHLNHSLPEQGGSVSTLTSTTTTDGQPFDYDGQARLIGTLGWERRTGLHVYQQYAPAQGLQFFHKLDYLTQTNNYKDDQLAANQTYTPFYTTRPGSSTALRDTFADTTRIQQDVYFQSVDNTFGVKGIFTRRGASYNYRLYYRPRIYAIQGDYNLPSATVVTGVGSATTLTTEQPIRRYDNRSSFENYIGGWLGYYFPDSLTRLTVEGEALIADIGSGGNTGVFRLHGQLESKWFEAGATLMQSAPSLLSQRFVSNVSSLTWTNSFANPKTVHLYGQLNVRYKQWQFTPSADSWLLTDYIYFNAQARPVQERTAFTKFRIGFGADYQRARFRVTTQAYYLPINAGNDVLPTPTFFANGRIQYDFIYAKVLHIQTGLELHYKSAYYAPAYMPVTQQYYVQGTRDDNPNRQLVEGALLADVFANMRVNRVRFFLKMQHVNMGLPVAGYFVAPGFPQIRRGFGFGVDWLLFD